MKAIGLPAMIALVVVAAVLLRPPVRATGSYDFDTFGKIAVVDQGRIKPLDTLARTTLLIISDRQTWEDEQGRRQPAIVFLADAMTSSLGNPRAETHAVFRIENDQLLSMLRLEQRSGLRYSLAELKPQFGPLSQQVARTQQVPEKQRTPFQNAAMELAQKLNVFTSIVQWQTPLIVPPAEGDQWRSLFDAAHAGMASQTAVAEPGVQSISSVLNAYAVGEVDRFNEAVAKHRQFAEQIAPTALQRAALEWRFNQLDLFGKASVLYVVAFVLACLGWMVWRTPLGRSALTLVAVALVLHTVALVLRMILQGRPPVTNLYSSAIFIGWGCAVFALILEAISRNGLGTVTAAVAGFLTLRIAYFLSLDGDTLVMMQAVLDTNFWLATHVITITLGYSATFLAGLLGILFILRGMFTRSLDVQAEQSIGRMVYGTVCFALLLSFVGTVLGGIWADQSWGRFWGWDPKENGALLIVLWHALVLHLRWDRMISHRGMAVMAVGGNIITAWSWFGVNMLGAGLHAYGFMAGGWMWLALFAASQLALVVLGMMPRHSWASGVPAVERSNDGA
jgi:ABC-type transport system involved in cytochrome c biogenesis permease subunit